MKQRYTYLLSIFCALFLSATTFAQSGNNCANSVPLTVNVNSCSFTQVTNQGLTNSGQNPIGTCPGFAGGDLWMSIVLPPSGEATVSAQFIPGQTNFSMDINMAAYEGTCGTLSILGCDDDSGTGFFPSMDIIGTPGETIFLQFWDNGNNEQSPFNVCANGAPTCASPSATFTESCIGNNQYEVDVNITNLGDASEVSITDGTNTLASGITSTGVQTVGPFSLGEDQTITVVHAEDASCNVSGSVSDIGLTCENILTCGTPLNQTYCYGNNDDTRFLYTSPSGSDLTITFNSGLVQSPEDRIRIYDGVDASGSLLVNTSNGGNLSGVTATATSGSIYLRVTSNIAGSCQDGSLGLGGGWDWDVSCDALMCDGATNITSQTTFAASLVNANLAGQSYSGFVQCDGPGGNADQFYTFTAVGTVQYIRVEASGDFNPVVEVFSECDGSSIQCTNDAGAGQRELFWMTGLTIGNQYAFRVYNDGASVPGSSAYTAAVAHIPTVQLRASDCGSTGLVASSIIRSTQPNPAYLVDGFVWEFTELEAPFNTYEVNSPNGANPQFRMYWFANYEYGRSYSVRTKARMYQGPNEGEYGPVCTISMAGEVGSALQSQYENGFFDFCDIIKAVKVDGATNYRWEFDNGIEVIEYNSNSGNYFCALQNVNGLELATTYAVQVFVTSGGSESTTSIARNINTVNTVPNTALNPSYIACGSTASLSQHTQAYNVCDASLYTFRFTNVSQPEELPIEKTSTTRVIIFGHVSGLIAGDTYNVAVKANAGGLLGDYSTECEITFLAPPTNGFTNETTSLASENNWSVEVQPELTLYPNPVTDAQVLISVSDMQSAQQVVVVRVFDMSGRLMTSEKYGNNGSAFSAVLNLDAEMATGIYIVKTTVDGELLESKKLIVE